MSTLVFELSIGSFWRSSASHLRLKQALEAEQDMSGRTVTCQHSFFKHLPKTTHRVVLIYR